MHSPFYVGARTAPRLFASGTHLFVTDPQNRILGVHGVSKKESVLPRVFSATHDVITDQERNKTFFLHRLLLHRFDHDEVAGQLPLHVNADFSHSISFNKGCYLGQEVTARAHFTGMVRKRASLFLVTRVPVREFPSTETLSENIRPLLAYIDLNAKHRLEGMRLSNGQVTAAVHVLRNWGNIVLGLYRPECHQNFFLHEGLYFYRLRNRVFERFLATQQQSNTKLPED